MAWTASHVGPDGLMPKGYWGEITSSLLWCEDKYRWSKYIAEVRLVQAGGVVLESLSKADSFVAPTLLEQPLNSFTNIGFIGLALFGARNCVLQNLPLRFTLTNLGIAFVGCGSFAFHATLLYEAQLLDELPMIYTSLVLSYCILEDSRRGEPAKGGMWLPVGLVAVAALITAGYLALPNPVLHQVAYAVIQIITTLRVLYLLYSKGSPLNASPESRAKCKMIKRSYQFGTIVFLTGFLIWNVDNIFCDSLRLVRARVGTPFSAVFQGHAWWHILVSCSHASTNPRNPPSDA